MVSTQLKTKVRAALFAAAAAGAMLLPATAWATNPYNTTGYGGPCTLFAESYHDNYSYSLSSSACGNAHVKACFSNGSSYCYDVYSSSGYAWADYGFANAAYGDHDVAFSVSPYFIFLHTFAL